MSRNTLSALTFTVAVGVAALLIATPSHASAQTPPKPKPAMEGHKMDMMGEEHASSGWKELDAFHTLLAATWHPAQGKNDLAPIKAKAGDMASAAKVWAASTAPKGCDTKPLKDAVVTVNAESAALAALVAKGSDDATVKSALKTLHEHFEVVEMGCKPEHKH